MKTKILFVALLISTFLNAQENKITKIDSIVNAKVKPNHPGIAVGIVKDGTIIYEKYLGLANLQHQVKFDEKTRSNIASTAKQFTALMILDLSIKEKLSLEDDIRKYLTKLYPTVKEKIKIRNLLNHTSGIRDYVELLDLDGAVWWQRFGLDNDDVLEMLKNQEDLGFQPSSKYSYSNSNYIVLTKIIEKITGKTFNEYSKSFFENLGMNETSFVERYMKVIPNRANPYSDWGRGEWWEVPTVTKTNGEGFLFTTLKDQLTYEIAVQNANYNNNVLLIESQKPISNSKIKTYGFGLELKDKLGRKSVHHSGGTYGFHSQTYRFPEEKLTIFAMSNNGNISTNLIAQSIAKLLLPKSTEKPKYDSKFYEAKSIKNEVTVLGKYTYPNENSVVEILQKNGKTFWKEKNFTVEMVSESKNTFSFTNNPELKVVFYQDKMTEYYASGKTMHYKRINTLPVLLYDLEGLTGNYYNKELAINFDLKLTKENKLKFKLSTNKDSNDVEIYNRKYMQSDNFFLKIVKDQFDRVTEILLTYGRAKNIRFRKKTNLKFQPKIKTENGSINVTTIGSRKGNSSQILLTKNYENGNEIWFKKFGGKSYDKANSILATNDGYLIIGSTSSYGNGNYDMYVIKTNKKGKKIWQNTYGDFYNEYGYFAEKTSTGFLIKGTKQNCTSNSDINRKCTTNVWFVNIDKNGKEVSNKILEQIKD
ncbi:serine hydrolase [Polaribacter sp. MED152]|uniref:serine hydrolase domain-containing protein n=1 Tax=Polaribacter sp. MED152 TaxID=313598 RepID=UPI000068C560|nr:serine hydrolase domain-containing protein [Polaribacter sp. MED152]EAQ42862.1 beta-lactamase [Polaribacter sp. MED152]